jgi:hypothetical protein
MSDNGKKPSNPNHSYLQIYQVLLAQRRYVQIDIQLLNDIVTTYNLEIHPEKNKNNDLQREIFISIEGNGKQYYY